MMKLYSDGHIVLSAHGEKVPYLQSLHLGDSVRITHGMQQDERPYSEQPALVEFIGGSKVFLDNGKIDGNWPERHPRSPLVLILIPRRYSYLRWMVDRRVRWYVAHGNG